MNNSIIKLRHNEGFSLPQASPDAGVLAAFSRGGARDPSLQLEDLAMVAPRGSAQAQPRLSIVFTTPESPIPMPVPSSQAPLQTLVRPASIAWRSADLARAHMATEMPGLRRALAIAAVSVPMTLSAGTAMAAPPSTASPSAAPSDPTVPELPPEAPANTPGTTTGAATTTTTAPTGAADPTDPTAAPSTTTTAPSVQTDVPLSADAVWGALSGERVSLQLNDGTTINAKFLGHEGRQLILARATDGLVYSFPKSRVAKVNVSAPTVSDAPRRRKPLGPIPQDGSGLLVGGSLLTLAGAPVFITGLAFVGYSPGFSTMFILPGAAGLAGGISMLVIGSKRKKKYRAWMMEHAMGAAVAPRRGGWTGNLSLRF